MGRPCGEPGEIELTPIGVWLNGSRGVTHYQGLSCLAVLKIMCCMLSWPIFLAYLP